MTFQIASLIEAVEEGSIMFFFFGAGVGAGRGKGVAREMGNNNFERQWGIPQSHLKAFRETLPFRSLHKFRYINLFQQSGASSFSHTKRGSLLLIYDKGHFN